MAREIRFYEKHFINFYTSLNISIQEKVEYVFKIIRTVDRIPQKFLKYIEGTDGLYEIRIKSGSGIYRIFCCFDVGKIVVLFSACTKTVEFYDFRDF